MIRFDASGNILGFTSGYLPQIATADGGVIAVPYNGQGQNYLFTPLQPGPAATFDANLTMTNQETLLTQGWTGNTFQLGSVENALTIPPAPATPHFASFAGGNQSQNAASPLCHDDRDQLVAQYSQYNVVDSFFALFFGAGNMSKWPRFVPNCFEFTNSAHSEDFSSFSQISPGNTWALIKYPLIAPASMGYGLDDWLETYQQRSGSIYGVSRTITSGYRTPAHNASANVSGATASRHMLGDAIDFQSATHTLDELNAMNKAARLAEADFVEDPQIMTTFCANPNPPKPHLPYPCAHADWRFHSKGQYVHGSGGN